MPIDELLHRLRHGYQRKAELAREIDSLRVRLRSLEAEHDGVDDQLLGYRDSLAAELAREAQDKLKKNEPDGEGSPR